jgi:hypothetical protein
VEVDVAIDFKERSSGREPSGRFGIDLAEWNRTYVLFDQALAIDSPVETTSLTDRILLVTGTTKPGPATGALGSPGGAGSIDRVMPTGDPQFPSLFADVPAVRVPSMEAYQSATAGATTPALAVPPLIATYSKYNAYEFDVPFSTRPFAVLPNSRMTAATLDFYDTDNTHKRLTYYPEWRRFVQTFVDDVDSRISAAVGSAMAYRVPSLTPAGVNGSAPTGIPDMIIPDQKIVLRWYGVPMRYVTSPNSYLLRYKGFINQSDFLGRVRGSLLYFGAKTVKAYYPPQYAVPAGGDAVTIGSFGVDPILDLDLSFIFTARRRYAKEAGPGDLTTDPDAIPNVERPNNNWVDGPHNWMPHFYTKRFFYVHTKTPDPDPPGTPPGPAEWAKWVPYYLSVPHEILFQDPDVAGVVVDI